MLKRILLVVLAFAHQTHADELPLIDQVEVASNLYWFRPDTPIGNQSSLVLIADDAAMLVDANIDSVAPVLKKFLASNAPDRPWFAVISHHHGDHAQGLEVFDDNLVSMVPTPQRRRLQRSPLTFPGSPPLEQDALPPIEFDGKVRLNFNGETVDLIRPPASSSHTDGDVIIYFNERDILYLADHYFTDRLPLIDFAGGGSIDGYLDTLNWIAETFDPQTKVIPGHATFAPTPPRVDTVAEFAAWADSVEKAVNIVDGYVRRGLSEEEAVAEGLPEALKSLGEKPRYISGEKWISAIFRERTREYNEHARDSDAMSCDEIVDGHCYQISPDFPYATRFIDVLGSSMAYIEAGHGDPIVFVHGNPTWSYVWRNVFPYAATEGRAIALDLIGMGRSGKPDIEYRFGDHTRYFESFVDALGLERITLVVHDWGSGIALDFARRHPDRIASLVLMEAAISTYPSWESFPEQGRESFRAFRTQGIGEKLLMEDNVFIERVLFGSIERGLSEQEKAAYREPFLNPVDRKPLWRFPNEVPIAGEPADVAEAISRYVAWLQETNIPKLLFHADNGSLIPPERAAWAKEHFPNLTSIDLGSGNHFVQEDHPHRIGQELRRWLKSHRPAN